MIWIPVFRDRTLNSGTTAVTQQLCVTMGLTFLLVGTVPVSTTYGL